MQLRDKNGLTETEFLAAYTPKNYPKPSVTADIAVFRRAAEGLQLLLIRRGGHPYLGCWALPGGFANASEPLEATAARELQEETGLQGLTMAAVGLYSAPGRDPRGWVISQAYTALAPAGTVRAGDDAAAAAWFDVLHQNDRLTLRNTDATLYIPFTLQNIPTFAGSRQKAVAVPYVPKLLAFDHGQIILDAWQLLQGTE